MSQRLQPQPRPTCINYPPVVEPHEKESAEQPMGDEDGILPTVALHHVPVQGLQEGGHPIKHVCTTGQVQERAQKIKWSVLANRGRSQARLRTFLR